MAIANVVALKKVVSQHESAPLNDVVKAINIKLNLADQKGNQARTHRVEAGEMLVSLRKRVEANGQDWWKFAKGHFDRERKELQKLMLRVLASKLAKAATTRQSVKEYSRTMKTTTIALSGIAIPAERLRALRQDTVDVLAASMKRHGLLHPVTLRKRPGRGYWIIAGAHRFVAAEKLGWKQIDCVILDDCTPDEAELVEIDENLARAELSPAETAMHIGRRKEIYERQHPETKHGGDRKGSSSQISNLKKDRFTADTARKTGKSEAAIQRDATRAKKVEVLADITNTSLDKGSELDALAKLPGPEQRALAARAKAGEKISARGPRNPPKPPEPPKIDPNAVKQAGAFHIELTSYTEKFVERITAWHAANPELDEEGHYCVVQALEMASMRLQRAAQDIDGR